jgi:DNA-binding winged helix-turn-helix (wHTH) protein
VAVTVRFGEYALDEARRELLHRGAALHLTPKAYELLRLLLERRPAAVSKAEIHDRLWPGTFVSDVNLARLVFEIRGAIGDTPDAPRFIRTVRGFGYAFCSGAAAEPPAASAPSSSVHYRLIWGEREIALQEGENLLGRAPEAALWIDDGSVSRRHARVTIREGTAVLEDLGSRHGTRVDGAPVQESVSLRDGARIELGRVSMVFRALDPVETDSRDA